MYRILVADDEASQRTIVTKIIQEHFPKQLEVIPAVNGKEAVRLYQEEKCNIALLDIVMPGMNGMDAAETIARLDTNGVIIFLTACEEFEYAKRAFAIRALDYLVKPVEEDLLCATLKEAIEILKKKKMLKKLESNQETDTRTHENVKLNAVADSIYEYIKMHYQKELSLQDVADHLNYSDVYFCKLFKQCFGKSFRVYLTEYRIKKAKKLLADISLNIKEIGVEVGYQDPNYFTRVFKRMEGITPTEYRLKVLRENQNPTPERE